jgi:hypothetical protein
MGRRQHCERLAQSDPVRQALIWRLIQSREFKVATMAAAESAYVPTLLKVKDSLDALANLGAHRALAGYLCVLNAASAQVRTSDLRPDFRGFFDRFFRIGDPPSKKPYAVPFARGAKSILFNENVAGSYAPSSLRPVNPLHSLMEIKGGGGQASFTLRDNHIEQAKELLLPKPLPIYAFACFMYRDFGFTVNPDRHEIENAVGSDFGFALENSLFGSGVFADDLDSISAADFQMVGGA